MPTLHVVAGPNGCGKSTLTRTTWFSMHRGRLRSAAELPKRTRHLAEREHPPMTDIDTGLNVWQMTTNHNRMIEIQADRSPPRDGY